MTHNFQKYQHALHQHIDTKASVHGLLSILKCVDMTVLQQFAHSFVNTLDPEATSSVYHRALSINEVLSDDAMQHVLSFLHPNRNRTVCKIWKPDRCSNKTRPKCCEMYTNRPKTVIRPQKRGLFIQNDAKCMKSKLSGDLEEYAII